MIPMLYEGTATDFGSSSGLIGYLSDAISCNVTESINNVYELKMVYPMTGVHYSNLTEGAIIYASHSDGSLSPQNGGGNQPFEIYQISRPFNGKVTILAWHNSYKLRGMICKPFSAISVATAMSAIENNVIGGIGEFELHTDIQAQHEVKFDAPTPVRSIMGGIEGSLIDVFGGEWAFDGWQAWLCSRRGQNTDITIKYGVNLTDARKVTNATNLWTSVVPFWTNPDTGSVVYYDGIIRSSFASAYPHDITITVDASDKFETEPTQEQLLSFGESYITANAATMVPTTINVSFVALWQTEEYKNFAALQRLYLGDTINVDYERLGINNRARIVETDYNVLLDRYDSMIIGKVQANVAQKIQESVAVATESIAEKFPTKTYVQEVVKASNDLITGGLGGNIVYRFNSLGQPIEMYIMDTDDVSTAVNVWRYNAAGWGASTTGINGPYTLSATINGGIVADAITTGTMSADRIVNNGRTLSAIIEIVDDTESRMGDAENTLDTQAKWFTFSSNGFQIAEENSSLSVRVTNADLQFLNDGVVVSYVNGQKLYIRIGEIIDKLIFRHGADGQDAVSMSVNVNGDFVLRGED